MLRIASLYVGFESHTDEMQWSLIQELMLYEFEQGHNATRAIKNICYTKDEGTVNHNTVTRWF